MLVVWKVNDQWQPVFCDPLLSMIGIQNQDGVIPLTILLEVLHKRLHLQYDGEPLPAGVGVQSFATGKHQVADVRVNGRAVRPGETDGWYAWHDVCATYVVVAMPDLRKGQFVIDIRLR